MKNLNPLLSCGLLAAFLATPALTQTASWTNPSGGPFSTGSNWDTGNPPGWVDTAIFDLPGTFSVDFGGTGVGNNYLLHKQGTVTFDMGGAVYDLNDQAISAQIGHVSGDDATLIIRNGVIKAYADIRIGVSSGAVGHLIVDQFNSEVWAGWFQSGQMRIGISGDGRVTASFGGTIDARSTLVGEQGTIDGNGGVWKGDVVSNGLVTPGESAIAVGTIDMRDGYEQTASGTFEADIDGTLGGEYDLLVVGGSADLGGTLTVRSGRNYTRTVGDRFRIISSSGGRTGTFDELDLANNNFSPQWIVNYDANGVEIEVVNELVLVGPTPGLPNMINDFSLTNATPGETLFFAYSIPIGSTPIPGCPGLTSPLDPPVLFDVVVADAAGNAATSAFVPPQAAGLLICFQVVELSNCRTSNMTTHVF